MVHVETIDSLKALDALEPAWTELLNASAARSPFLTFAWIRNWWKHFGGSRELRVFVVTHGSRPVLIAPLMKSVRRLQHRYIPLPAVVLETIANYHSNRADFICSDFRMEYLDALWRHLTSTERWHILRLFPLLETTPLVAGLRELVERQNLGAFLTRSQTSPYLPLPRTSAEFLNCVPKQVARKVRKAAKEAYALSLEHVRTRAGLHEGLNAVCEISRKGWAAREQSAISSTGQLRGFYEDLAELAADRGWLVLSILRLDGKPIAFEYNLQYDSTLYNLKLAFDPAFAHCSPGRLLKQALLAHVVEHMPHIREYDMLGEAEPYKLEWSELARSCVKAHVYRPANAYARNLYALHCALLRFPSMRVKMIWKPDFDRGAA